MTGLLQYLRENAAFLLAGVLMTFLSSFGQTFFISIFAGELRSEFGLGHRDWGLMYTVGTALSALAMIRFGGLTDTFRVRVLGPVALAGLALACLFMALNPSVWLLPAAVFALRFAGQGMTVHISTVAMVRWFRATRGRALAIAGLGFSVGEAFLPIAFVAAMGVVDWRSLWIVAAVVALAGAPVLSRLLRLERTPAALSRDSSSLGMQGRHWTRADVLKHPVFWLLLPALLGPPAFNTAFFFQQVHFAESKGWTHASLVAMFPVYTAATVSFALLSGWAMDRLTATRLLPFAEIPMIAGFVVMGVSDSAVGALPGLVLLGMGTGAFATLPLAFWAEVYGTAHIGSIRSLAAAVMVFGSAIGPGISGTLLDAGVDLDRQYLWVSGFFALATIALWLGSRRARLELA